VDGDQISHCLPAFRGWSGSGAVKGHDRKMRLGLQPQWLAGGLDAGRLKGLARVMAGRRGAVGAV
jgi:hypothetical protein